ncbi:MAG TPA: hypothetical protein VLA43_07825 [Longimicrobiales bacterium]|nr:hypothetical protein [Longimicrobiales bacterium]
MKTNKLIGLAVLFLVAPGPGLAQESGAALIGEGAQVFAANCTRCHNARAGNERSDAHWVPITLHMRARANLTGRQARAVLAFLQATNQDGTAATATSSSTTTPTASRAAAPVALQVWSAWIQVSERVSLLLRHAPRGRTVLSR